MGPFFLGFGATRQDAACLQLRRTHVDYTSLATHQDQEGREWLAVRMFPLWKDGFGWLVVESKEQD